jgi:hypothetical protein
LCPGERVSRRQSNDSRSGSPSRNCNRRGAMFSNGFSVGLCRRYAPPARGGRCAMVRIALAFAVMLTLASSGANAQEAQPPGSPPSEMQQPGGPPPEMQPGGPPAETQPGGPPSGAQAPGGPPPGAEGSEGPPPAAGGSKGRVFRAACRRDLAQFCSQLHPGKGRLWRCVKQHFPQLSPSCQQLVVQSRGQ